MVDQERLTAEQGIVAQGVEVAAELSRLEDHQLAGRIAFARAAAFAEGMREGEAALAAQADEPESGTLVGTVQSIRPDEIRARRWGT